MRPLLASSGPSGGLVVAGVSASSRVEVRGGPVYVVSGAPSGTVSLSAADTILMGEAMSDQVGTLLSTVDYDGDGALDLVIGAPYLDGDAAAEAGEAYVVFGAVGNVRAPSAAPTTRSSTSQRCSAAT